MEATTLYQINMIAVSHAKVPLKSGIISNIDIDIDGVIDNDIATDIDIHTDIDIDIYNEFDIYTAPFGSKDNFFYSY